MREIKFRCWDKIHKQMLYSKKGYDLFIRMNGGIYCQVDVAENSGLLPIKGLELMQYTGLKDKKKCLTDIYEYDIIDKNGKVIGNKFENENLLKEETNLLIQDFGGKTWGATYDEAMERGCRNSE